MNGGVGVYHYGLSDTKHSIVCDLIVEEKQRSTLKMIADFVYGYLRGIKLYRHYHYCYHPLTAKLFTVCDFI